MEPLETNIVLVQDLIHGVKNPLQFRGVPSLDFLMRKHIIKPMDEWEPIDEPLDENPLKRTILFKNKIRITSEFERLVLSQDLEERQSIDDLPKVASKIIDKLPNAKFSSVGINIHSIKYTDDPSAEIKERFLKHIPKLPTDKIVGGSISYIYKIDDVVVTMSLSAVKRTESQQNKGEAIAFNANYHLDISFPKKIQDFVLRISEFMLDHKQQSNLIFG